MNLKKFIIIITIYTVSQCLNGAEGKVEIQPKASQPTRNAEDDAKTFGDIAKTVRARLEKLEALKISNPNMANSVHYNIEYQIVRAELAILRGVNFAKQEIFKKIDDLKTQASSGHKS